MRSTSCSIAGARTGAWWLGLTLILGGCRGATPVALPPVPAGPLAADRVVPGIPAMPAVRGAPLVIAVRYPAANQVIVARDSNFILGSIGTGDASLTINGVPVAVAPNGAFLGWLPLPPAGQSRYDLLAVRGADTVRRSVTVRFPVRRALPAAGPLRVDSTSVLPGRGWWASPEERLRVSVRAPGNAMVVLVGADGVRRPLRLAGTSSSAPDTSMATRVDSVTDASATFATEVSAALLADSTTPARLLLSRGADSLSLRVPLVRTLSRVSRTVGMLRSGSRIGSDTDRAISARTIVNGTYKWQLLPQTLLEVTGRQSGFTRVRLDEALDVWVDSEEITLLPDGTPLPRRVSGGFRLTPADEYADLTISLGDRPAHHVEAEGRRLVLTLYGVQANPEISPLLGADTLVRRMEWEQVTSDRVRITLHLTQPAYGWLALWDDARRAFVLRVRRVPRIDAVQPLAGLTIAVDPGHPPAGSTGPTGLYEGDAVFPVGLKVAGLLRARGAHVVMTRTSLAPVGLAERGVQSRRENAHAFLSIHLNALPDGVNPFTANGTSTLFYHNASEPLAREVQQALQARFGLRDLGVHYQNLAVARPSWYPSALAEGLFLMIPEQEAAMRDEAFQLRYAEGLVAGLERYFRWLRTESGQ
jgi:N-acetylmuramoyl-L-alanine amidase